MKLAEAAGGVVGDIRRELERNVVRTRNGIRYATGTDWAPEVASPRDLVWSQGKAKLWRLRSDRVQYGPPVLMFIGLVSGASILDLHQKSTLAGSVRDAGYDVFVLDWGVADQADAHNTIETYLVRYLPRAVRALLRESGADDVTMLGYCMGGCFAVTAVGGGVPLPLRNLVVVATPIDFHAMGGYVEALRTREIDPEELVDWTGNVPPGTINAFFRTRKPTVDAVQYATLWENLWNDEFLSSYQAMARWASSHVPLPGATFRQLLRGWLEENGLLRGTFRLAGERVDLGRIRVPTLSVVAMRDDIVLPDAALPLGSLVGAEDFELFQLDAGHAGLAGSRKAVKTTFPGLVDWLGRHSDPLGARPS